ncbi:hypothetical protein QTP70_030788 [Hemibagrus guttatus]|uniref:Endonuclease/exonuclease/phosphatase domain-containing protein n=1 Tax=Hemibagrus guttatus TaxID=175788 RepID=A0AAE0UK10_9TELE|nr:hypothetical protein QTP70_030788 [Hemibagrus guttatus]
MSSRWYKGRIAEEKGHPLGGSSADVLEVRDMRSQPNKLPSVCQEIRDPTAHGVRHIQLEELVSEQSWDDRVKSGTKVHKQPGPQSLATPDDGGQELGHCKRCSRKWKHGKWVGVRARLKTNPSWLSLSSIILSNVCSLDNKLDYIRLQQTTQREYRDCCVFVFMEMWLSDRVLDATLQLDGLTVFRADRNAALCGKTLGGSVCVYINMDWCKNSVLVSSYYSSLVEFVTVRCRPFYLPWEFTTAFIFGVYIPSSANAKEALCELYGAISELQNGHPDGLFIIAGDFNHANIKSVLPKFHQHVHFATRGTNTLDLVYTNIPGAYRAEPRPHIGYSDHISVMLIPAYRLLVRRSKPVLKQVKIWPAGAISALQDCCECIDWKMFREAATNGNSINLEEYTTSLTSYIGKCIDDVTVSKNITTCSNQKRWMTAVVRALLKSRYSAFRTGDKTALRTARAKLSRAIREAKRMHAQRIHGHFQDSRDSRRMCQGMQATTNYKTTPSACDRDASLPDVLNDFYARFEAQNNIAAGKTIPPPNDQVLYLSTADVRRQDKTMTIIPMLKIAYRPLHIVQIAPRMMPSPQLFICPSHTWTIRTHMYECCSQTSVQHSTQSFLST